jgi:hypothetical protein
MSIVSIFTKILEKKLFGTNPTTSGTIEDPEIGHCRICGRPERTKILKNLNGECADCHRRRNAGEDQNRSRSESSETPRKDLQWAYNFLRCNPSDSDEAVHRKWRAACKECHPDMNHDLETSGATRLLQEVNEAYEIIQKARGRR